MLSDRQIKDAKTRAPLQLQGHFEHNDCIRIAYEWLDAQVKTKTIRMTYDPIKHIVEKWGGRYVSQSDVEVAAWLHPDIIGSYPNFNISSRLTFPSIGRLSNISEAGKHNRIGAHYNESTYSREEDHLAEPFPSPTTLNPPDQSAGPKWRYENGQIKLNYDAVLPDPITDALHAALRQAARDARNTCGTLGNKFPDLWAALCSYVDIIDVEHHEVVEVSAYVTGLDLDSRFRITCEFAETIDNEHPKLGMAEVAALERVVKLHAPYIQSTPLGSQITELADRENRTPEQTRELATQIGAVTEALLEFPDLVDATGIEIIRDSVLAPEDDPKLFRRVTLSQVGLRNLAIVIGTISVVCIAPAVTGAVLGGQVAGASGVVGGVLLGSVIAQRLEAWLRPVIMDTEPFKEVKIAATNSLNDVFSGERPKFKAIASMYTKVRDQLLPVIGSPGIDEWFDALNTDLEKAGVSMRNSPALAAKAEEDRSENPKLRRGYVGYTNADWKVDADGMVALDGSHDLTISEIFGITKWQKMNPEDSVYVYHSLLHFNLKSRVDFNTFVDAWRNAVDAHTSPISRQIDVEILENTIKELMSTGRLNSITQEQLQLFFDSYLDNPITIQKGDDSLF